MALNLDTLGLSATVTAQGISAPDYQTILDTLTSYFRQIYGSDAYLEPDSKDGQMVALVALAVHDANNTAIEIYNSFSPMTAQAAALSSNVKINGITRKVATNSTADLLLTGTAGTTIKNGSARDKNGIIWNFPASVAIGVDGTVLVTATCANSGSVAAMAGTITTINTPTRLRLLSVHQPKPTQSCAFGRGKASRYHRSHRLKASTVQSQKWNEAAARCYLSSQCHSRTVCDVSRQQC